MNISNINGSPVFVNDLICVSSNWEQYKFPKQKSYRRVKKWRKNRNNFRMKEVHSTFIIEDNIYVSSKVYSDLVNKLPVITNEKTQNTF